MKVVVKKLSELKEASKNIRRHNDKQITEYIRSIEMFGQIKPIVIDEHGEIIAGNGLYRALMRMGRESCECYIMEGLTPAQKKKLMLADNRVYELGITDVNVFEEIVLELDGDFDIPGWDEDLLSMMNASLSDVDEMVSNYGIFGEQDIDRISEHEPPQSRPLSIAYDNAVKDADPQPVTLAPAPEPVTDQAQQYMLCPHCGRRIPI